MLSAYAGLVALLASGGSVLLAIAMAIAVGALLGLIVYFGSFRFVSKKYWTAPALSTVGIALILQTGAARPWGTDQRAVPDPLGDAHFQLGLNILLKGMTGMVIGGLGNVYGAMFGGVLVGVLEVLAVSYLSSSYQDVLVFAALIAVLMFKPAGFFGVQVRDRA